MPEIREAVTSIEGLDLLVESLAEIVAKRMEQLYAKIQELESKLNQTPQIGPQGEKGDRGEPGDRGEKGEKGETGSSGEIGPHGPKGEKGDPGEMGPVGERGMAGEPGPRGERGDIGLAGEAGKEGPQGTRGEKGEKGLDGKDGRDGRDGINGKDGRDAIQIDILPEIDKARTYPRGTFARFQGGLLRSYRDTSPITEGIEKAGWEVIVQGSRPIEVVQDNERTFVIRQQTTDGIVTEQSFTSPVLIYRGIYQDDHKYQRGDVTTWNGCAWHCQKDTQAEPGSSKDWLLMVREGRAGRPAPEKKAPPNGHEPIRLA